MYIGDGLELLRKLRPKSVSLVATSPPYPLIRKKAYGNVSVDEYIEWAWPFFVEIHRVLRDDGSLMLNLGGVWHKGLPLRSLYQYEVVIKLVRDLGFKHCQDFVWVNPAAMPVPAEWVTVRRIRVKVAFEYVWWLSPTPWPQADNTKVLVPYGPDMRRLLARGGMFKDSKAPSGHKKSIRTAEDKGGAIPPNAITAIDVEGLLDLYGEELAERCLDEHPNVLVFPNTDSRSRYFKHCRATGLKPHPARFPAELPEFFIKLCTEPEDVVVDPFGGSGTTARVAETLGRRWLSCELDDAYVEASKHRFEEEEFLED
jgi:DNA modification methylase